MKAFWVFVLLLWNNARSRRQTNERGNLVIKREILKKSYKIFREEVCFQFNYAVV
jgi:hypothetical protein